MVDQPNYSRTYSSVEKSENIIPILREFLDGTSSSGINEALLAKEHFGKEIHIYSPAFTSNDVRELASFSHAIIFNSNSIINNIHTI